MTYCVCGLNNLEEKITKALKKFDADAIILLVKRSLKNNDVYSKVIKLFGRELNLYILEDQNNTLENYKMINVFCKNHLGYNDKYNLYII